MKTSEIKQYIKECSANGANYTPRDFYQYIVENYGKKFTKGQFNGALAQLLDKGELLKVERGVYRTTYNISEICNNKHEDTKSQFISEILECLSNTDKELSKLTTEIDVLNMNKEEFLLLGKIKYVKKECEIIIKTYE